MQFANRWVLEKRKNRAVHQKRRGKRSRKNANNKLREEQKFNYLDQIDAVARLKPGPVCKIVRLQVVRRAESKWS